MIVCLETTVFIIFILFFVGMKLSYTERKHSLGIFENRVLRKVLGHKTDEVTEEWRRLHNEEL
jgi:hypothetical protein